MLFEDSIALCKKHFVSFLTGSGYRNDNCNWLPKATKMHLIQPGLPVSLLIFSMKLPSLKKYRVQPGYGKFNSAILYRQK